jgi:hypothetical protein
MTRYQYEALLLMVAGDKKGFKIIETTDGIPAKAGVWKSTVSAGGRVKQIAVETYLRSEEEILTSLRTQLSELENSPAAVGTSVPKRKAWRSAGLS